MLDALDTMQAGLLRGLWGAWSICAAPAYPRHSQTNAPKRYIHLEKYTKRGKNITVVFFHLVTSVSNVNHYIPHIVVTFNAFFPWL